MGQRLQWGMVVAGSKGLTGGVGLKGKGRRSGLGWTSAFLSFHAEGGTRTRTGLRPLRPERSASTSSTTSAKGENLIPRHPHFNPISPRVDSAREAPHAGESSSLQQLQGLHGSNPEVAERHYLRMTIQLPQPLRQLPQRDQPGTLDVGDVPLVRLADIDQHQTGTLLLHLPGKLLGCDLRAGKLGLSTDPAERLVVDQLMDRRVFTAEWARRVLTQLKLAESELER